jgi:hypothetical protein
MHGLLVEYELIGATSVEHAELSTALTPALAAVRGLVSLIWLSNETTGRYGALYVFECKPAFDAFVAGELYEALRSRHSVSGLIARDFSVQQVSGSSVSTPSHLHRRQHEASASSTRPRRPHRAARSCADRARSIQCG